MRRSGEGIIFKDLGITNDERQDYVHIPASDVLEKQMMQTTNSRLFTAGFIAIIGQDIGNTKNILFK